jgi:hypothetical protein
MKHLLEGGEQTANLGERRLFIFDIFGLQTLYGNKKLKEKQSSHPSHEVCFSLLFSSIGKANWDNQSSTASSMQGCRVLFTICVVFKKIMFIVLKYRKKEQWIIKCSMREQLSDDINLWEGPEPFTDLTTFQQSTAKEYGVGRQFTNI